MGVHVKYKDGTDHPYLVIFKDGRRVVKRMPDEETAEKVAAEIRLRIARQQFRLPDKKDEIPTLAEYFETLDSAWYLRR